MNTLTGMAIVVTGASRGIGRACAKGLAASGSAVIVNDIDEEPARIVAQEIVASGGQAKPHIADISCWSEARQLIERCITEFGVIDGLVNNAANVGRARLESLTEHDIKPYLDTNIIGTINCAAHAVRPMLARGKGSIVNVTSGAQMGAAGLGVYGATKGAVASLTYAWAIELRDRGIRVNAVSPLAETRLSSLGDQTREYRPAPDSNVPVIEYLLSDASAGVNGQIVKMDGEFMALCTHPAILAPIAQNPRWTYESVKAAFERGLSALQLPLGPVAMEVQAFTSIGGSGE